MIISFKKMPDASHSIPDLFSETTPELGSALFGVPSSDLAPNAAPQAPPMAEARHERRLLAVACRPMLGPVPTPKVRVPDVFSPFSTRLLCFGWQEVNRHLAITIDCLANNEVK